MHCIIFLPLPLFTTQPILALCNCGALWVEIVRLLRGNEVRGNKEVMGMKWNSPLVDILKIYKFNYIPSKHRVFAEFQQLTHSGGKYLLFMRRSYDNEWWRGRNNIMSNFHQVQSNSLQVKFKYQALALQDNRLLIASFVSGSWPGLNSLQSNYRFHWNMQQKLLKSCKSNFGRWQVNLSIFCSSYPFHGSVFAYTVLGIFCWIIIKR